MPKTATGRNRAVELEQDALPAPSAEIAVHQSSPSIAACHLRCSRATGSKKLQLNAVVQRFVCCNPRPTEVDARSTASPGEDSPIDGRPRRLPARRLRRRGGDSCGPPSRHWMVSRTQARRRSGRRRVVGRRARACDLDPACHLELVASERDGTHWYSPCQGILGGAHASVRVATTVNGASASVLSAREGEPPSGLRGGDDWAVLPRRASADLVDRLERGAGGPHPPVHDTITPRRIYALPIGHRWSRVPGVTGGGRRIRDVALRRRGSQPRHARRGPAGTGDRRAPRDVETALSAYETAMFSRAQTSAEISAGAGHVLQRRRPTRDRRLFTAMRPADHDADHDLSLSLPPVRRAGRRKVQVPRWRPRHGSQRRS